ncbi:MAG: hypothetical protein HY275_14310 [Gemmatimonadetes bacterium]|nr:hypothetical protein [Gemmatimonadota bacterium]
MATLAHVRRIASELPGAIEGRERFGFGVRKGTKERGFCWSWKERVDPKKPRVENLGVLAVRVANVAHRDIMIAAEPDKYFTEPHYNNYPAVLVRLSAVKVADLRPLLQEAHALVVAAPAPRRLSAARPRPTDSRRRARSR